MRQIAPPSVSLSDELRTTATTDGPAVHGPDPDRLQIESHRFCPGCSSELFDRGCKLRCPRCGFFLDCSDG